MLSAKCYAYKDGILLVDVVIDDAFENIDLMDFSVPEETEPEDNWQVPYMEQYFDINADKKICDTYDEPDADLRPVRILFFIFESPGHVLKTPYGNVDLLKTEVLPQSILNEIEFEDMD